MIVFTCHVCRTSLSADEKQAGQLVRCPTCMTALRAPIPEMIGASAASASKPTSSASRTLQRGSLAPGRFSGKRYGFNCGYCSSRLEANETMAAQDGQCPTCGNQITIPILDRYGRLIDPKTREIIKQDPHPVHAYAAAGERAPGIRRNADGKMIIICPRCAAASPIMANNCKSCGMPFTMEGTTLEASGSTNGYCVASLVLGIIGMLACFFVPSLLAITFGILGLRQTTEGQSGKALAIAGIVCGVIGLGVSAHFMLGLF
jgi:hypothetical protein